MELENIGMRIRRKRKEMGITQLQIQELTGISSGNLSDIENGRKLPSAPTIIALSDALDCSTDWILKGVSRFDEKIFFSDQDLEIMDGIRDLNEHDKNVLIAVLNAQKGENEKMEKSSHFGKNIKKNNDFY